MKERKELKEGTPPPKNLSNEENYGRLKENKGYQNFVRKEHLETKNTKHIQVKKKIRNETRNKRMIKSCKKDERKKRT